MRRVMMAAVLTALFAVPVAAQHTRAEYAEAYEMNQKALHELVAGLSEAQWNFKPAADRWSILEVVEHLAANEMVMNEMFHGGFEPMEISPESEATQAQIKAALADRSQKFQAPESVQPNGRWATGAEALEAFDKGRGGMIHFFGMADWDLRTQGAMHPVLQAQLDAAVWSVLVVEHTKRHMAQIQEVMKTDGYPSM